MRLRLFLTCFWILIFCNCAFSHIFPLHPDKVNLLIVGEKALIKTQALDKNTKRIVCKTSGEAIRLIKRQGTPSTGYIFEFKAVKPGEAVIIEEVVKHGKQAEGTFHGKSIPCSGRPFPISGVIKIGYHPNFGVFTQLFRGYTGTEWYFRKATNPFK